MIFGYSKTEYEVIEKLFKDLLNPNSDFNRFEESQVMKLLTDALFDYGYIVM